MKRILTFALLTASLALGQTYPNSSSFPSFHGIVFLVTSGSCPAYSTEVSALNGVMLQGTINANQDVGNTGGSNSITPTGTISQPTLSMAAYTPTGTVAAPIFSGIAGTIPAETFTGNALATHTHTLTPTGTNAAQSITSSSTEVPVTSPTKYVFSTLNSAAAASSSPSITIPAEVFTGALDTSSAVSAGTPAGTNSTASFTPSGTNSAPAFSGAQATLTGTVSQPSVTMNAFDPHPAFVKVIFCAFN